MSQLHSCHVSPLPVNTKKQDVVKLFQNYHDLSEVFIARKTEEHRYTFGFVRFKSRESADEAVRSVIKNFNGVLLSVNHSGCSSRHNADSRALDNFFAKVFEDTWGEIDAVDKKGNLDSILKGIRHKKLHYFARALPMGALSVEITETAKENIDYKLWHTFFREQKYISKPLMEISQTPASKEDPCKSENPCKSDSTQPNSFTKETGAEENSEEDEGLGSFCTPDPPGPESPDLRGPSYEPKKRKHRSPVLGFWKNDSKNDKGTEFSSEDERFRSFEEEKP